MQMPAVTIHNRRYDLRCIIFDKDGTLIDFNHTWGRFIENWIGRVLSAAQIYAPLPAGTKSHLEKTLGYDPVKQSALPDSPLVVTTVGKIEVVAMAALYQLGYSWEKCEAIMAQVRASENPLTADDIQPLGDVPAHLHRLKKTGILLVLATNDDRAFTEETIEILGMQGLFSMVLCGDDPHPSKPDPAGIKMISDGLNIKPSEMMMVGDTLSDMQFAVNGEVSFRIGVGNTAGENGPLKEISDTIIQTIDEIEPVADPAA